MITVNRCLDLCSDAPTNHPKSAAHSVCNQPVSGCKFPPEALKNLIGGTLVREHGETRSELPGHCVSVSIWGVGVGGVEGGEGRMGGVESAVVKVRVQQT